MRERPLSLTIVGWFLIVTGVLGVLGTLMVTSNPMAMQIYAQSPLPLSVHIGLGVVGTLISILCGYGVLKGLNWSRFLYAGWSLIGFAVSVLTIRVTSLLVLGLAFYAVIVFFLFRPAANAWFAGT